MKTLPIGDQTFEGIIKNKSVYVDKTKHLYNLIKPGRGRYFLSRPRRFGKSTTCSTLEAILQGRKELFKGLWIEKSDYRWQPIPVLRFDFNEIDHATPDELRRALFEEFKKIGRKHGIELSTTNMLLKQSFTDLVCQIADKSGPIAIIIDEYDKPITDNVDNLAVANQMRNILKSFYESCKNKEIDTILKFLFITGVSKFSKVTVFSGLNNLSDISLDEDFAAIVGYTDADVDFYLKEHIQAFADKRGQDYATTRELLRTWYNGYHFSKGPVTVYNPFSLHNCLTKKDLNNYWFTSGTPSFLIRFIEKNPLIADEVLQVENEVVAATDFDAFQLEEYYQNFKVLLLQTGYLTIKRYDADRRSYELAYPNAEVRESMSDQVIKFIGKFDVAKFSKYTDRFRKAIIASDIEAFCTALSDFYKLIPHTIRVDREKFYHGVFFIICKLLNFEVTVEDATELGYIDAVIKMPTATCVMEFKKDKSPNAALAQIKNKKYFEKFHIEATTPVILVGVSFHIGRDGAVVVAWKKA